MNTIKTTKETEEGKFTNKKSENGLIFKRTPQTVEQFVSFIEYKPQN